MKLYTMKYLLLFMLSFLNCTSPSKKDNTLYKIMEHGTLLIAGVGKDGIVIAADSRITRSILSSIGNHKAIAYKDSCQKIFLIKKLL